MKTSMRKNDRNTCAPYKTARLMRMVAGIRVLHRQPISHTMNGRPDDSTHPCRPLVARTPVNNPASSLSTSGELRPLTVPPRALPLLCALSVAAIFVSAIFCASRSHSYSTPSATMARHEKTKACVVEMCHERNTMHVFSICVFLRAVLCEPRLPGGCAAERDPPEHVHRTPLHRHFVPRHLVCAVVSVAHLERLWGEQSRGWGTRYITGQGRDSRRATSCSRLRWVGARCARSEVADRRVCRQTRNSFDAFPHLSSSITPFPTTRHGRSS